MNHVNMNDVPTFKSGSGDLRVLLSARTVGAESGVLGHGRMEPGTCIPAKGSVSTHSVDEYSFVLSGQIRVWVEGEERTLVAGDSLLILTGQQHVFRNDTAESAEFVWFLSPGLDV